MEGKPFDLTQFVKSFDLTYKTGFKPEELVEDVYSWSFPSTPTIDLSFEMDSVAAAETMDFWQKQQAVIKMEQRGRFWFDRRFEVDITMTDLEQLPDGSYTATYKGLNFIDTTDNLPLARFLRWVLRR